MEKLPMVVLSEILSHAVEPWGSPQNSSLLLVSKTFRDLALPMTIKTFKNPMVWSGEFDAGKYKRRNARFLRYILLHMPYMAQRVQSIVLQSEDTGQVLLQPFTENTPEILRRYREWLISHATPLEHVDAWIRDLGRGCNDAHLALMLLAYPGLVAVSYDSPRSERDSHVQHALEMAKRPGAFVVPGYGPPLSRLQHMAITTRAPSCSENWDYRADKIKPVLFTFPRMCSLAGLNLIGTNSTAQQFEQLPPRSSSVEFITLVKSYVTSRMLKSMIESCRELKSFTLVSGMWLSTYHIVAEAFPQDVMEAMLTHADTLEYLHVRVANAHARQGRISKLSGRLFLGRDLAEMKRLKVLIADAESLAAYALYALSRLFRNVIDQEAAASLMGVPSMLECIPSTLEYLQIHECTGEIESVIQPLLLEIGPGRKLPRLRHIRLFFDQTTTNINLWFDSTVNLRLDFQCT